MFRCVFIGLTAVSLLMACPVLDRVCGIDALAMQTRLSDLNVHYEAIYGAGLCWAGLSDIACDAPALGAHQMMCGSAESSDDTLWRMGRLDTLTWIYTDENATGTAVDLQNPPIDAHFIAVRDACTDEVCLKDGLGALIDGLSMLPYVEPKVVGTSCAAVQALLDHDAPDLRLPVPPGEWGFATTACVDDDLQADAMVRMFPAKLCHSIPLSIANVAVDRTDPALLRQMSFWALVTVSGP